MLCCQRFLSVQLQIESPYRKKLPTWGYTWRNCSREKQTGGEESVLITTGFEDAQVGLGNGD